MTNETKHEHITPEGRRQVVIDHDVYYDLIASIKAIKTAIKLGKLSPNSDKRLLDTIDDIAQSALRNVGEL